MQGKTDKFLLVIFFFFPIFSSFFFSIGIIGNRTFPFLLRNVNRNIQTETMEIYISQVLSLYGKIQVRKKPYSGIF